MFHIFPLVCFLIYGVKRRQVLIAKPQKYLFLDCTPFIFLLTILSFFSKINAFLNKIGPIWDHKGPYGPQPGPGLNPDWALTIWTLMLSDSFNVFFRFLDEKPCRTIMKLPERASRGTKT